MKYFLIILSLFMLAACGEDRPDVVYPKDLVNGTEMCHRMNGTVDYITAKAVYRRASRNYTVRYVFKCKEGSVTYDVEHNLSEIAE